MSTAFDAPPALQIRIKYDTRSTLAHFFSWDFVKSLLGAYREPDEANRRLHDALDWATAANQWLRRADEECPSVLSLDAIAQVEAHAGEARGVVLRLLNRQPDVYFQLPRAYPNSGCVPVANEIQCPCPHMTLASDYLACVVEAELAKIEMDAHALFLKVQDWRARRAEAMLEADRLMEAQAPT